LQLVDVEAWEEGGVLLKYKIPVKRLNDNTHT
jgi:hypothetical protein